MQPIAKFFSLNKFVNLLKDTLKKDKMLGARVYFEGSEVFKNKFGKLCIKPLLLIIRCGLSTKTNEYYDHQKILDLFEAQPIVSFSESKTRFMPDKNDKVYYLDVDFNEKEFNGVTYYPSEMFICLVQKNEELVRKHRVKEIKEPEQEIEIPPESL